MEKELNDSFPELSTVLSLPVGLITGPGEFWKPKLLNVLVKGGLSVIRRGDNQQDQRRESLPSQLSSNWAATSSPGPVLTLGL